MKKILLIFSLFLLSIEGKSQVKNRLYTLYYPNKDESYFFPSGMGFRNDTLYLDTSALVNVIAIRRESNQKTMIWNCIPIKALRYKLSYYKLSHVKKDTTKKSK